VATCAAITIAAITITIAAVTTQIVARARLSVNHADAHSLHDLVGDPE
jgi:hypothetical protein